MKHHIDNSRLDVPEPPSPLKTTYKGELLCLTRLLNLLKAGNF